jgi:hypothetical protein
MPRRRGRTDNMPGILTAAQQGHIERLSLADLDVPGDALLDFSERDRVLRPRAVEADHGYSPISRTRRERTMQTIDLRAEIDEYDEIRIKVPAGHAHQWARILVTIPDQGPAGTERVPLSEPTSEAMQRRPLKMGLFRGRINMADDFNDPLPDSFWLDGNP